MQLGIIVTAILICGTFAQVAHADWFSDRLNVWKKAEEERAIQYQKEVLHFDYSKIQNKDPGFKTVVDSKDIQKKHIQNTIKQNFKVIKNFNN